MKFADSPYLEEGVIPLLTFDEDLDNLPDPTSEQMADQVLPDDWTPDGNS